MFKVADWMLNVPRFVLISAIHVYRLIVSPAQIFLFGPAGGCRFTPTCSAYAMDALREHGAIKGTAFAAGRICRCHPWGGGGHDPIPKSGKRPMIGSQAESGNILGHANS
jgi:putative membrane protein insertion efficiency factor